MKNMKKMVALVLALVLCFALVACGGGSSDTYTVGVVQLTQHVALDAATQGFVDALKEELGDKVDIKVNNASNDVNVHTANSTTNNSNFLRFLGWFIVIFAAIHCCWIECTS